jgi:hypothetical protein
MIIQLHIQSDYQLTQIPFSAGIYDVKIIRCDVFQPNNAAINPIRMHSDRLPLKNCEFIEYFPIPAKNVNRDGLFFVNRNISEYNNATASFVGVNSFNYCESPLIFKDVYLDGFLDTEFFNTGTSNATPDSLLSPPSAIPSNQRRILLLLDIIPKKIYKSII